MNNSSRTKKFFYNSVSTGIYQVIVMTVGFITPRVMLKGYGSEINGLVTSITQFITYFNLVEAGIAGAGVFALYQPLAENDYSRINGILSAVKKFYYQAGYIFTGLIIELAILYPLFVKTDQLSPALVGLLIVILGAKGFLEFFTLAKYRVLLTADQKTYVISIASSIYTILNTILIVVFVHLHMPIVAVYAIAMLSLLSRSAILFIYVKRKYKSVRYEEKPATEALDKRWPALFLQILGITQTGAPVVIATIFTTLQQVSIYAIYNMILTGINGILSIFVSGLSASFGDLIARKEMKTLQKAYNEFEFSYHSLITIVYSVSFVLILPFVQLYTAGVSDINYSLPLTGFLFVLNGLLYNMKTPQGMMVISAGLYKETMLQSTIQGAIIILFGCLFGSFWGLNGILLASCLSNLYRTIDLMFFIPINVTKLPVKTTLHRYIRQLVAVALIYLPFQTIQIHITSYHEWIVFALVVTLYAITVVLSVGLIFERNQIKPILTRVKGIIRRS